MSLEDHIPVMLKDVLAAASPVGGVWLDGTLGAGGYTRALLEAGAERVLGVDRDPEAHARIAEWAAPYGDRFTLCKGVFSELDLHVKAAGADGLDGVVLDIGVSSMQLDQALRGFSFQKDGPLDMRMSQSGLSAAELVNTLPEADLADILFQYGEERASRKIARAICAARKEAPFETTFQLVTVIERCLPRPKPKQPHPATRSFQALRIAVNDELGELARGLMAAERALRPGGKLIVVTFHSLEDRIVKRFMQMRSGNQPGGSRYAPLEERAEPTFSQAKRKAVLPDEAELEVNPRARSAKLRLALRGDGPITPVDFSQMGLPKRDVLRMQEGQR